MVTIHKRFTLVEHLKACVIYPDSTIIISNASVMNGEDLMPSVFEEWSKVDTCWLYKYDYEFREYLKNKIDEPYGNYLIYPMSTKLLKRWIGPWCYQDDSVHNFFNYNSWEDWRVENDYVVDGIVQFTIQQDDLK